jgi:hypothetical protein
VLPFYETSALVIERGRKMRGLGVEGGLNGPAEGMQELDI